MRKRICAMILVLVLAASILPASVLAAEENPTATTRTVTVKNFWGPGDDRDKVFTFTVGESGNICLEYMEGHDPDGYTFGGFVSDDSVVKSSGPEYRNMVFTMPDRDVTVSVKWVPVGEITYVFTFNGKENSSTISTGIGATISVNGAVLATAATAGETITANVHPGDMVTVYSGERNSEKKKCSSWMSSSPYKIPDSYLTEKSSTITFPMPSGPANLTARWSDAYTVTVKNYNGTQTKTMPGVFLPEDQIDFDIGTYAEHALGSVKVYSASGSWLGSYPSYPHHGAQCNLLYFLGGNGTSSRPTLRGDITIEVAWTQYGLVDLQIENVGTGGSQGGLYSTSYDPKVPIHAGDKEGSTFSYWSSEGHVTILDPTQADTAIQLKSLSSMQVKECKPVTLTAHWDESLPTEYMVTIEDPGNGATGAGNHAPGEEVTVNAGTKEGYRFTKWTVCSSQATLTDSSSAETTFTMPAHQVTLLASWRETHPLRIVDGGDGAFGAGEYIPSETVTIDAGTRPGYIFKGWKIIDQWDRTFIATVTGTQATFTMPSFSLVATANWEVDPNAAYSVTLEGAGTDATGAGNYAKGATVTVNAGTKAGHTFAGWTVTAGGVTLADANSLQTTFTMPEGNVTLTANWTAVRHTLTVKGLPGGDQTQSHAVGEAVTVSAGTRDGYTFNGWVVVGSTQPTLPDEGKNATTSFTMPDADVVLLATWTPEPADGVMTLYLDELPGPLSITDTGYTCVGEAGVSHAHTGAYILAQRDPNTPTANSVTVRKGSGTSAFNVTLKDVNIAASDSAALLVDEGAKLTLTLRGNNTLQGGENHAGLELKAADRIPETAVTIDGTAQDSLTATGGDNGAGIGGSCGIGYGTVTINGGTITATGGKGAAGIGSGNTYAGSGTGVGGDGTVIINSGVVIASGTTGDGPSGALLGAAGIGAGYGPASGDQKGPYSVITITGGDVTATGVGKAPAIGGTYTGMIYISGGTVTTHRGDGQSTAEIGKCPDASGGVCDVHFCERYGHAGDAQIFVSGPNAISNKPTSPTGTANYYWNAIVYEGDSGQLYCSYDNKSQTMELETLTVPAGKTLRIPKGVLLKLPQDGLHYDGASFAGEGRVLLGETYYYPGQDGKLTPCEAMLIDSNGVTTTGIFNTLETILTGTIGNDGSTSWLVYGGHKIRLLTDVDYPADIDLTGTRCTEVELDLNGKTLNMGAHTILADVEDSTVLEHNVFAISDSSSDGSGKIVGNSANATVRSATGRLEITGGAIENRGEGPAVQIENVGQETKLSGGSFSRLQTTANAGFTPKPLVGLLAAGTAFYDSEDELWISPASKRTELSHVQVLRADAGLLPVTTDHEAGSDSVTVGGLPASGAASCVWLARSSEGGAASAVPGVSGAALYLNNGTLEEGGWYVCCKVTVGGVTMLTDEIYVEATAPTVRLSVAQEPLTYSGAAQTPAVTVTAADGTVLTAGRDYILSYENNVRAGTARAVVRGTEANPFEAVQAAFQIAPAALTVQAKDQTIALDAGVGSDVSLATAAGLVSGDRLAAITLARSEDGTQVVPSSAAIRNAGGDDVTDCYAITYRPGALTVSSGGGSSSSDGASSRPGSGATSVDTAAGSGASAPQTTAAPSASVSGGTAASFVSSAMGSEIVKQAAANQSGSVVVAPRIAGDVSKVQVTIPASTVGAIADQTTAGLTVSTPVGDVSIPNGALGGLAGAGGNLTVTAEQADGAVTLTVTAGGSRVEQVPGGVTLAVPTERVAPGLTAVLVREDGSRQVVRKSALDGDSVIVPLDGSARVEIVDNSRPFTDIPAEGWVADAAAFVSARELFGGTGNGKFSPEQPMSRGMLAVVFHNLENNPEQALTGAFGDVKDGAWYSEAVSWAAKSGIMSGYGSGRFGPEDEITREQLAVMLWRYAGSPAAENQTLRFADADRASAWALDALCWATEQGILRGRGDGTLNPIGQATRAETAQMIRSYFQK